MSDALANLKRDPSGEGFAHLGSDNVVRTFDKRFDVIDFAQLDSRGPSGAWPRTPGSAVLEEAKRARARSEDQTSRPRARNVVEDRQLSCVGEFCPDDRQLLPGPVDLRVQLLFLHDGDGEYRELSEFLDRGSRHAVVLTPIRAFTID